MIQGYRHRKLANQTLALLGRERKALLAGDIEGLSQISQQLARLADRLAEVPLGQDTGLAAMLEQIRSAAQRNSRLIGASQRGLKTVSRLQAEQRDSHAKLSTYTVAGKRQDYTAPKTTNDRRT